MKRNNQIRRCRCPCNRELKDRYKGREKTYFDSDCRKVWHSMTPEQQQKRIKELEESKSF